MDGVTTALVGFIFVCVVYPHLVKSKAQYYVALFAVCAIILLDALGWAVGGSDTKSSFRVFVYVFCAVFQVIGIVMLFLSCGGLTLRELAGDVHEAIEVMRRGSDEKEIIIPLSGEMARLKAQRQAEREAPSERYEINDPAPAPPAPPPPPAERGSLPLEP